jgi:general secretion pathway protein M
MNIYKYVTEHLRQSPASCAVIYFLVMLGLFILCWLWITNLQNQRIALASATEMLERLRSRSMQTLNVDSTGAEKNIRLGSPFLEGQTVTLAGAGLLERVSKAVTTAGGRVLSSQLDLQPSHSNPGFVSVVINCDIDQIGLQKLLFDIEEGIPSLVITQLEIQSSDLPSAAPTDATHVVFTASGQWLGKQ